jgi:hypothetical protein
MGIVKLEQAIDLALEAIIIIIIIIIISFE